MNIQPGRCSAPTHCTLTLERVRALHSHPHPGSVPSPPGARKPPQGTYLALAFECAGRRGFHLGFQTSFREEEGKKKNPIMQMDSGRGGARWIWCCYCMSSWSSPNGQIYGGASRLRQVPPPEHLEVN